MFYTYHERFDFKVRFPRTDLSFITFESPTAAKRISYKESKDTFKSNNSADLYLIHITGYKPWLWHAF